jgi:hypothetical protein
MRMLVLPSALRALAPVESERGKRARSASRGTRAAPWTEASE